MLHNLRRMSVQLLTYRPRSFDWTLCLQTDNLNQVDDTTHIIGFILLTCQTVNLDRNCRVRLFLKQGKVMRQHFSILNWRVLERREAHQRQGKSIDMECDQRERCDGEGTTNVLVHVTQSFMLFCMRLQGRSQVTVMKAQAILYDREYSLSLPLWRTFFSLRDLDSPRRFSNSIL